MKRLPLLLTLISFSALSDCRVQQSTLDELTCVIYFEAGNQGSLGMELVGETVLNRVRTDGFPETIHQVINQKNQYTNTKRKVLYKESYLKSKIVAIKLLILDSLELRRNQGLLWFHTVKLNKSCRFGEYKLTHKNHVFCGE